MINEPEADAVVELAAELCADPDYDGMDIGVVSLLGSTQSKLIWDKLYDRLGPEVMRQRRLRSGEPANFQGDERDVIIISTVVAVDPALPASRISAMTGNAAMRRINVAASRARQQMWIVHSADPSRFPDGDLRGALIRHCQDAGTATTPPGDLLEACESQFERDVLHKIMARGYHKLSVQHTVGRYRIDIVVEGPHARLAVECDGDRWHGPDAWHKDRARQQVLERAGWTFERIRGSAFYSDPDTALLPLWQRLAGLGIPTGDWSSTHTPQPVLREVSASTGSPGVEPAADEAARSSGSGLLTVPDAPPPSPAASSTAPTRPKSSTLLPGSIPLAPSAGPTDAVTAVDAKQPSGENRASDGAGQAERAAPTRGGRSVNRTVSLLPYQAWTPHVLAHPDATTLPVVIAGLREIVAAEGPIHAQRAYRLYTRAGGGHRVGTEMRRTFHKATRKALRTGDIRQLDDNTVALDDKTLYLPGKPSVLLRELGPRQLLDVPRSEVAKLIKYLGLQDAPREEVKRAVLNAYGLVRLTARTSHYLDECLTYNSPRSYET
jgi:very-short-patch-repair endonuclease